MDRIRNGPPTTSNLFSGPGWGLAIGQMPAQAAPQLPFRGYSKHQAQEGTAGLSQCLCWAVGLSPPHKTLSVPGRTPQGALIRAHKAGSHVHTHSPHAERRDWQTFKIQNPKKVNETACPHTLWPRCKLEPGTAPRPPRWSPGEGWTQGRLLATALSCSQASSL